MRLEGEGGMFQFSYVEFVVLVGYSGSEVQSGVRGAGLVFRTHSGLQHQMWLSPCDTRELWAECNVSRSVQWKEMDLDSWLGPTLKDGR